ncbi:MAG: copper chaperone PCu(A)C [Pseudomonadota bacterium]
MTMLKTLTLAAGLALALAAAAAAHEFKIADLEIDHPWARATVAAAKNGAVFLVIKNEGRTADRLIAASSPVAEKAELHEMAMDNDVMKMRMVEAVDLPAGQSVALEPGGFHVMLMGLKKPLEESRTFPVTLTFEKAGNVTVTAVVEAVDATEPSHDE